MSNIENLVETTNKCCLSFWYPKISTAKHFLPLPETRIIEHSLNLLPLLDGMSVEGLNDLLKTINAKVQEIGGYPCFLRTGHTSGKHYWKDTCYLPNRDSLGSHIAALVNASELGFLGLPCNIFVVRKLIPVKPSFYAFDGKLPITREFRFFSTPTKFIQYQPYWPEQAIKFPVPCHPEDNWQKKLEEQNKLLQGIDFEYLKTLSRIAVRTLTKEEEEWSVDWLQDRYSKWWLIDMAVGSQSFKSSNK